MFLQIYKVQRMSGQIKEHKIRRTSLPIHTKTGSTSLRAKRECEGSPFTQINLHGLRWINRYSLTDNHDEPFSFGTLMTSKNDRYIMSHTELHMTLWHTGKGLCSRGKRKVLLGGTYLRSQRTALEISIALFQSWEHADSTLFSL